MIRYNCTLLGNGVGVDATAGPLDLGLDVTNMNF
jgi:hypothetical protein